MAAGILAHQSLALVLYFIGRVNHPFICNSVFCGPNGAVPDVFRKVSNICEDLRFRNLGEATCWINSKNETYRRQLETGMRLIECSQFCYRYRKG